MIERSFGFRKMGDFVIAKVQVSDKRAAILQTTLDLISDRGFHNTPMSLIAKEAGVSAGTIYHYFAGKDELIFELYRDGVIEADDEVAVLHTTAENDYRPFSESMDQGRARFPVDSPNASHATIRPS